MEIERKFFYKEGYIELSKYNKVIIKQYYLSYDPEIRIRKKISDSVRTYLTYKGNGDLIRKEVETNVHNELFDEFQSCAIGNIIIKSRYEVPFLGKYLAEVDIYEDNLEGLKVVEVEFKSENDAKLFDENIPIWFGNEITDDKRYKNKNLSKLNSFD